MPTVQLTLPQHRYAIVIERGVLQQLGAQVREVAPHARAALVVDGGVPGDFVAAAQKSLRQAGYELTTSVLAPGEAGKNLDTVRELYGVMVADRLERRSPVIALGGGVTGDTAGFVAATYLRGVPFVQCPTTLLAMVDASVGGKVGVNLPEGKNLVGAFHQPKRVIIDIDTLATLPMRELRCGLAECVKHAVIRDPRKFDWLDEHADGLLTRHSEALAELVAWNVQIKAQVVMADEKESGERAHLNFGHTFAHAIETLGQYAQWHHGEAVSLGMVAAARLAADLGLCDREVPERIRTLLHRLGLPVAAPDLPPTAALSDAMTLDKKVAAGRIRLVLPERLGAVTIRDDIEPGRIAAAWDTLR